MEPRIIYESADILAINKPAGLLVHPVAVRARRKKDIDAGAPKEETVTEWLVRRFPETQSVGDDPAERPGVVHRLDKSTSGVMLIARTPRGFECLKRQFQGHEVRKTYLALVRGSFKEKRGSINAPIGIRNGTLKRSVHSRKMQKPAQTDYNVKEEFNGYSLVEAHPLTGRTHQIRVHFSSIGHALAGDRLYGSEKQPLWAVRPLLHALAIEFAGTNGNRFKIEAESPEDFAKALVILRAGGGC